ncbi:DUF3761 domain-containing protein [Nocardia pseudovaccinii]|uniref:DUF3761 domain-containing protein n=1 Tax=Nocardia pseudovaccinii TaxID=189540 RepID=UPI003D940864
MSIRVNTLVGTGLALAGALTLLLSGCAPQSSGPGLTAATASITTSKVTSTPVATTSPQPTTAAPTTAPPTTSVAPPAAVPAPPAPIASAPPAAAAPLAQSQPSCGNDSYLNSDNQCVHRPQSAPAAPPGATARCTDGTYSYSQHRSGTCSHHGGVVAWL